MTGTLASAFRKDGRGRLTSALSTLILRLAFSDIQNNSVYRGLSATKMREIVAWNHHWHTCRCDCNVLKDHEKKNTERNNKNMPYPSDQELAQRATI